MNRKIITVLCFTILCGITGWTQGNGTSSSHDVQITIPEVALLKVVPEGSTVTLAPTAPTVAGDPLDFSQSVSSDNSMWLNYSSIVENGNSNGVGNNRKITVKYTGAMPSGLQLKVSAASIATGAGSRGNPISDVVLKTTDQDLITNIGSCYTQKGSNNGSQLTIALEKSNNNDDEYNLLSHGYDGTVTVTYTLSN